VTPAACRQRKLVAQSESVREGPRSDEEHQQYGKGAPHLQQCYMTPGVTCDSRNVLISGMIDAS
jgi:hypothetical protein